MPSPASAESERNSLDSPGSFAYLGGGDHKDELHSTSTYDHFSRFNSIASLATSESSITSYYSDFKADPFMSHDVHNASRRNSWCACFVVYCDAVS